MKKIICSFITISVLSILAVISASAQSHGTRVEANIPFDFTVGDKTFKAGDYDLSITRDNSGFYSVSLIDDNGLRIFRTNVLRSASTTKKGSIMEFAVVGGEYYLDTIKTPEIGFVFNGSNRDKRIAEVKRISVPTAGPQF